MAYGALEYAYAAPFADALVADAAFREWVLSRTKFSQMTIPVRLLHDEMRAARSPSAKTWWRSHFSEACRCRGCRGQETDLLAIFERQDQSRFALHIEVKQPSDDFSATSDQAGNYAVRAKCWIGVAPKAVLRHSDADTLLLCSEKRLNDYAIHLPKFGGVVTFEEMKKLFPRYTYDYGSQ